MDNNNNERRDIFIMFQRQCQAVYYLYMLYSFFIVCVYIHDLYIPGRNGRPGVTPYDETVSMMYNLSPLLTVLYSTFVVWFSFRRGMSMDIRTPTPVGLRRHG